MTENLFDLAHIVEVYNQKQTNAENQIEIKYRELMSRHTSFRIGGIADLYLVPKNVDSLINLCGFIRERNVRYYFLGNGTNVLFDDEGFRGAVVSTGSLAKNSVDGCMIKAEAGTSLNVVCKTARDNDLTGLEFAYGIPGSVGGAVYMNAGAYGGEIASVLRESTYINLNDLTVHTICMSEHEFGYRKSVYKRNPYVILSAVFELKKGKHVQISDTMNEYMNRRISKQPLEYPSAGSIFKRYPGRFTGQMIEECGLKGYTIGGAQVSEKHAGFIINIGGATSHDILSLIEIIKAQVYEKFGCAIECEVIYVK